MSLTRRDFLKTSLLPVLSSLFNYPLLSQVFNKKPISIEDLLLMLEKANFSQSVKTELNYRIDIQRKYGFDSNGKIFPLNRFIKESANFILYKGDFEDIITFYNITYCDIFYIIKRAAYHDKIQEIFYFCNKLIGKEHNHIYGEALLSALENHSMNTFYTLIRQKPILSKQSQKAILSKLSTERYDTDIPKLTKLLPRAKLDKRVNNSLATFAKETRGYFNRDSYISAIVSCIKYVARQLLAESLIDDYYVNVCNKIINVNFYQNNGFYDIELFWKFNKLLYNLLSYKLEIFLDNENAIVVSFD